MIRILSPGSPRDASSMIGKIVMKDASMYWQAVTGAMRVVSVSASAKTLVGRPVHMKIETDGRGPGLDLRSPGREASDDEDDRTMLLSGVRCVCDTVEEVVALTHLRDDAAHAFSRIIGDAQRNLRAMHGVEIGMAATVVGAIPGNR